MPLSMSHVLGVDFLVVGTAHINSLLFKEVEEVIVCQVACLSGFIVVEDLFIEGFPSQSADRK